MRSTPHQDPNADAPIDAADAAKTVASKATDAADAVAAKATDAAHTVVAKAADAADTVAAKATDAVHSVAAKATDATDAATQKLDDAVAQGKEWLQSFDVQQLLEQIPQPVRDLGTQVIERVRRLTPTQQIVGGAVLAFGVGLLATSSSRNARTADAKAGKKYRAKYD